jgi:hypothetical protein
MTAENPPKGVDLSEPLADGEVIIAVDLGTRSIYHSDRDCGRVEQIEQGRRTSRDSLYPMYRECVCCAGGRDATSTGDTSECPWCGEETVKLGTHLRHCGEEVDDD